MNLTLPIEPAPAVWIQITAVLLWLGVVGLVAEVLDRVTANSEVVRKAVHIGTGNVILLAWWLQIPAWIGIGASVVFSVIALISYRLPLLPRINSVGRKSLGTFFYAVSIGVLIAWFWSIGQPQYAALGILVMAWGDGLAALIGQRWGRHLYRVWGIKKSWEGSAVMGIVSGVVSILILSMEQGSSAVWLVSIGVALAATALEAISVWGVDNLTVPIGSAAIAFWLSQGLNSVV